MTTPRRRQIFAQRRRSALDPSGAAGSGPAATTPPPPVSREEEEARALIWAPIPESAIAGLPDGTPIECTLSLEDNSMTYAVLTPATDPTAATLVKKRKTLRLKRGRNA
jgi:hypothetical protein